MAISFSPSSYSFTYWLGFIGIPALAVATAAFVQWRRTQRRLATLALVVSWYGQLPKDLIQPAYEFLRDSSLRGIFRDEECESEYKLGAACKMLNHWPTAIYHGNDNPVLDHMRLSGQLLTDPALTERLVTRLAVQYMATRDREFLNSLIRLAYNRTPETPASVSELADATLELFLARGMINSKTEVSPAPIPPSLLMHIRRCCVQRG